MTLSQHPRQASLRELAERIVSCSTAVQADCVATSVGKSIAFGTNDAKLTAMLRDLLGDYVTRVGQQYPRAFTVRIMTDPRLANSVREMFENGRERRGNDVIHLSDYIDMVCQRSIDTGRACLWHIVVKSHRIVCSVMEGVTLTSTYEMFRVIRLLFHIAFVDSGLLPIHAAVVSTGDRGLCLMGEKFAGKTTLALQCLERLRWNFVANDKAYLSTAGCDTIVTALPVRAGIRPGTFERVKILRQLLDPIVGQRETVSSDHDRVYASPQDLANLFGVAVTRSAVVDAFIHLARKEGAMQAELQPLDQIASRRLLELQYIPDDAFDENPYWRRLIKRNSSASISNFTAVMDHAVRAVPSFCLHYSTSDDQLFTLLSELRRSGTVQHK